MITGMSGKTVHSVLLTVHCDTCFAGTTAKSLYCLSQNALPSGGGYPNAFLTDTGVDFAVTEGQDTVIDITDWFKARVAAGTAFYGFGVDFAGSYVSFSTLCGMEILYNN